MTSKTHTPDYSTYSIGDLKQTLHLLKITSCPKFSILGFGDSPEAKAIIVYLKKQRKEAKIVEKLLKAKEKATRWNTQAQLNAQGYNKLGVFNVASGALVVSDPCYEPGTWCAANLKNARNGKWVSYGFITNEGSWGKRYAELVVIHEDFVADFDKNLLEWKKLRSKKIGVDSGQCGIYDADKFNTEITSKDDYELICEMTENHDTNGNVPVGTPVIDYGWVTSSGFGDGSYPCFKATDKKTNQIHGVKVVFID